MQLKSVFYTRAISCRRAGEPLQAASAVLMLLLSAALLLASCANAVNSRGGPIDAGGGSSGSSGTSSGNTTINSSRGGGESHTAPGTAFRTAAPRLTSLSAPTPPATRLTAAVPLIFPGRPAPVQMLPAAWVTSPLRRFPQEPSLPKRSPGLPLRGQRTA